LWEGLPYFELIALAQTEQDVIEMFVPFAEIIWTYGSRPSFIYEHQSIGAFSSFTSMFMHGNLSHLLGNMFYLWAFGKRVEDACGPWRYLVFYLVAGMVANVGYLILSPLDVLDRPGVGASGAISGIMGAYLILFPGVNIACLWGVGFGIKDTGVAASIAAGMSLYFFLGGTIDDGFELVVLILAIRFVSFILLQLLYSPKDSPSMAAGKLVGVVVINLLLVYSTFFFQLDIGIWAIVILARFGLFILRRFLGREFGLSEDSKKKEGKKALLEDFSWTVNIPAWVLLIFFAVDNITASFEVIQGAEMGGVNTIAHMTGFLAAITIFLYVRKDLLTRYISGRRL